MVRGHDRADLSLALCRHARHAAPHGVLRLQRSGHRSAGRVGNDVGHRRRDPGAVGRAVPHRARARSDGGPNRAGLLSVQRGPARTAHGACRAEWLRALARPDGGSYHRELRVPDRACFGNAGNRGSSRHGRSRAMMSERPASQGVGWVPVSIGITAAIAVASIIVGFGWLPLQQRGEEFRGIWDAICSAAGLVQVSSGTEQVVQADYPTTRIELTPQMLRNPGAQSIGRGATLALRCTMCHGARGLSEANSPNLAGQYPIAIYKQLMDFKTSARVSAVMAPLVANLSDVDMRDLAAYYAYLPRLTDSSANNPP